VTDFASCAKSSFRIQTRPGAWTVT